MDDSTPRFPAGQYRARPVGAGLGFTKNGREQVAVDFELLDDNWAGHRVTWYGYFGDETKARKTPTEITLQSLRNCGWQGNDLSDLSSLSHDVVLVIEDHEHEGKKSSKVRWVNRPGGLGLTAPMTPEQAKTFAAKMRGKAMQVTAKPVERHPNAPGVDNRTPPPSDDIPF